MMGEKRTEEESFPVFLFSLSPAHNDGLSNTSDTTKQSSLSLNQRECRYNSQFNQPEELSSCLSGSNRVSSLDDWPSFFIPRVFASTTTAKVSNSPSIVKTFFPESIALFSHVKMEHLLAGVTGGVASTLILHPLDLVKIRFAVADGLSSRPQYDGLTHAFKSILKTEGFKGLYRGVTPNVWGAGSAWGLYFLFYNSLKTYWQGGDTKTDLGPTRHMIIAAEAGLLTLMITNPIWVVKTRLCLQYGTGVPTGVAAVAGAPPPATYYTGMADALVKVYQMEGIRGLYRGFIPGMFGVSHGAIQFMTYEEMKTVYNKHRNLPIDAKLGTMEYLSFAAISKLIAAGTTYPYQVVRARLQDQHRVYEGVMDVIRQTWRNEGFRGFYKGLVPNLIRVVPATAITFVVYEKTSSYLSSFRKPGTQGASANSNTEKKE